MKLKSYTPETCPSVRSTKPFISFSTKSGLIIFNRKACEIIGISEDSLVQLLNDENEPENWYLRVSEHKKEAGFPLRKYGTQNTGLAFNCSSLVHSIADSVSFTGRSGRVFIGESVFVKGTGDVWTLITAGLRNK